MLHSKTAFKQITMTYKITYISYSESDLELKNRSQSILNNFFKDEAYEFQNEFDGVIFVASGGSEQKTLKIIQGANNCILLCHRESNSYAASMEIASYLRDLNIAVNIIDVKQANALTDFKESLIVNQAIESMHKQKAAVIGEVSDWLINSDIKEDILKKKLGIEMLRLPWDELDDYRQKESSQEFLTYFPEQTPSTLMDTAKVYQLLEQVVEEHALSAISVECFSMVNRDQVTACLPLSVLNTKNIVAACEGDVCSMIGKMMIRAISNQVPWQANVAEIKDENILFAHCTAPLSSLSSFDITTHYESNCGTAIQGKIKKGDVGVFRINSHLDKYMLLEGEIVHNPKHSFACRTQIEFKTTKDQCTLLKDKGLGNHHLIFPAKHIPILKRMMHQLQINSVN